jgi:hypothetical protein
VFPPTPSRKDTAMEKLWDKIKKSVMEGVTTAAEKTEEYTKYGKAKLDILSVKHKISNAFTELGGLVYDSIKINKGDDVLKSEKIIKVLERLKKLDADLEKKEKNLEELNKKEKTEQPDKKDKKK